MYDFRNPPRPCEASLVGLRHTFGSIPGEIEAFIHLKIHDEPWARRLLGAFYVARPGADVSAVVGELRLVHRRKGPLVLYYGDRRLAFFDQHVSTNASAPHRTVLTVEGTDLRLRLEFTFGLRRRVELWIEGPDGHQPVHVFSAQSGLEIIG